jgi:hypothetical protein
LTVRRVGRDGRVLMQPAEMGSQNVSVTIPRLLEPRDDGQGSYYQWLGWAPRRYRTPAQVVSRESASAVLCLPEWHPARPVQLPARLLPSDAARVGAWLECVASLAAPTAGRLEIHVIRAIGAPPTGELHAVALAAVRPSEAAAPPAAGKDCGDIVVALARESSNQLSSEFFVRERISLRPGGRVYELSGASKRVAAYRSLKRCTQTPNGTLLHCSPERVDLAEPISGWDGSVEHARWRWRWWPREQEAAVCLEKREQTDSA